MTDMKKLAAAALALAIASASAGCTPSIGGNTKQAMTVDGYDIPAGLFIYYTLQSYDEAANILKEQNGSAPDMKELKNAKIDSLDSTEWIQNKATEYCVQYASVRKEYDEINAKGAGLSLSDIERENANAMAEYYYSMDSRLEKNGVSLDSMVLMAENSYMEQQIFNYYYGFEGEKGCSEDELKDYFDENFARVKYLTISLTDDGGEKVSGDEERTRRKMAKDYAERINKKTNVLDMMHELDKCTEEYNEYVASLNDTEEEEAVVTTTAAEDESEETTTTTTDPFANERLIQKQTTTAAEEESEDATTTAVVNEVEEASKNFNDYLFNTIQLGKAEVYDYDEYTVYVVLRGDLRERMTEDDFWSEDYISRLQSNRYYNDFNDFMQGIADGLSADKNKAAYRRYEAFKLEIEEK